jgi:hypothetical protein
VSQDHRKLTRFSPDSHRRKPAENWEKLAAGEGVSVVSALFFLKERKAYNIYKGLEKDSHFLTARANPQKTWDSR